MHFLARGIPAMKPGECNEPMKRKALIPEGSEFNRFLP